MFREKGDLKQAVMKYSAAHEIIPNFEDTPVRIINLEFEMGNTKKATLLLDEQIKTQVSQSKDILYFLHIIYVCMYTYVFNIILFNVKMFLFNVDNCNFPVDS